MEKSEKDTKNLSEGILDNNKLKEDIEEIENF